jgi:predicted F0F1-ATPase subunit
MNNDKLSTDDKQHARAFWRLVASASSLGWSMILPIVGGVLLGKYLDEQAGSGVIWTVGLLFGGVAMALYNMYYILFKETIDQ